MDRDHGGPGRRNECLSPDGVLSATILDAREAAPFAFLVPLLGPVVRADREGELAHGLAGRFVAVGLLQAHDPFVVAVPAARLSPIETCAHQQWFAWFIVGNRLSTGVVFTFAA
eukprot:CAMPEP_0118894516 /NCGR_PEP_ID=MMETSP1166-20130328/3257_1 /TAXON_ID=1104430 /ORGANISM="Chrysoreinhardia sp, Strain CCMP3193" /LENGTH=113 /DNA_ID=CAMNT_0006833431 /DNA_START=145 /DNA_END=487 /DNA_ORIENTATION=-